MLALFLKLFGDHLTKQTPEFRRKQATIQKSNNIPVMESNNFEFDENNGLVFSNIYIPPEIVTYILTMVDEKDLEKLSFVCKKWFELSLYVWKHKAENLLGSMLIPLDLKSYKTICLSKPFCSNLLNNPNDLNSWECEGDWIVENTPVGCDPFPEKNTSCFATTYTLCTAYQLIDLKKLELLGFVQKYIPDIYVSEWFGCRFDCESTYKLKVELLAKNQRTILDEFNVQAHSDEVGLSKWKKYEHTFSNYPKTARFILFTHVGKDTRFWAGHYGSKMCGATVKLLPNKLFSTFQ